MVVFLRENIREGSRSGWTRTRKVFVKAGHSILFLSRSVGLMNCTRSKKNGRGHVEDPNSFAMPFVANFFASPEVCNPEHFILAWYAQIGCFTGTAMLFRWRGCKGAAVEAGTPTKSLPNQSEGEFRIQTTIRRPDEPSTCAGGVGRDCSGFQFARGGR
jgi:hypothetical protein